MARLRYSEDWVALLRSKLEEGALTASESAGEWAARWQEHFRSNLGLLALHGASGLAEKLPGRNPIRLQLCAVDDVILHQTKTCLVESRNVAIGVPPGPVMTPMLMVVQCLLDSFLEQHMNLEAAAASAQRLQKGGVLLVSPDAEVRSRYFGLMIGEEPVSASFPASRLRDDGTLAQITANEGERAKGKVCFYLARRRQLPDPHEIQLAPGLVILDLTRDAWMDRLSGLIEWCKALKDPGGEPAPLIALYPYADRASVNALEENHIPLFPIDSRFAGAVSAAFVLPALSASQEEQEASASWSFTETIRSNPLDRLHTLVPITSDHAQSVQEIVRSINELLDALSEYSGSLVIRRAVWLLVTLTQLPVPVEWYEQHAFLIRSRSTLRRLIADVDYSRDGGIAGPSGAVLQSLRGNLELLYSRLREENPKSSKLLDHIRSLLDIDECLDRRVQLLVRDVVTSRALGPWLMSEGLTESELARIEVRTFKEADARHSPDLTIMTGAWPARYRWKLAGNLGSDVHFLLYPAEEDFVEPQLRGFFDAQQRDQACKQRIGTAGVDLVPPPGLSDDIGLRIEVVGGRVAVPPDHSGNDHSGSNFTSLQVSLAAPTSELGEHEPSSVESSTPQAPLGRFDVDEDDSLVGPTSTATDGVSMRECMLVVLEREGNVGERRYMYLEKRGKSECFVFEEQESGLRSVENEEMERGHIFMRSDRADRRGIFDELAEVVDAQPTLRYLRTWRKQWLEAIDMLSAERERSGETFASYQQRLAGLGVEVTVATVRSWLTSDQIGPGSVEAISAVGVLSKHPGVERYAEQIDAAFRQIRAIHRALGRRISAAIRHLGARRVTVKQDDSARSMSNVDPAVAAHIEELLDLIEYWRVVDVDLGPFTVPTANVESLLDVPAFGGA